MDQATDKPQIWLSAHECNDYVPDHAHFGSTIDNLAHNYSVSGDLQCWPLGRIDPVQVDPYQLIDDPDDHEGHAKVAAIRTAVASGARMPPVIVVHQPRDAEHPYDLMEGRHRYNAALVDRLPMVAWVAHIGCCGGPAADLLA